MIKETPDEFESDFQGNFDAECSPAAQRCAEECAQKLSEHYDAVRIVAVHHKRGISGIYSSGRGNFYAQIGGVKEWVMRMDEGTRQSVGKEE